MVLDASAIVSILLQEPGFRALAEKINDADPVLIGAPTVFEAAIVLENKKADQGGARLKAFLRDEDIEVIPFGEDHQRAALSAFLRFGKGRHPAQLNFGDCLAYAIADIADQPLLYVGDDFSKTDIKAA